MADIKPIIILPLLPEHQDYGCVPPYLAKFHFSMIFFFFFNVLSSLVAILIAELKVSAQLSDSEEMHPRGL